VSQAVACHGQLTHRDAELFQDVVERRLVFSHTIHNEMKDRYGGNEFEWSTAAQGRHRQFEPLTSSRSAAI
jgi:hypothetical protein